MAFFDLFSKSKISDQLKNSSQKLSQTIAQIFTHKKLDSFILEELEETLITSDLGSDFAREIINNLRQKKFEKNIDEDRKSVV
jgi:fused signal recognition particle receptor